MDRAYERGGKDWISGAARPHDPPLSIHGSMQATALGKHLLTEPHGGIPTRIIVSPLIRTVQTAYLVAKELGLPPASIWIEEGLCEEAKSMRYPQTPYLLKNHDLMCLLQACDVGLLNVGAASARPVRHIEDQKARVRDLKRNVKKLKAANGQCRETACFTHS